MPAGKTSVVPEGKTSAVSADKTSAVSQDIPTALRRRPQRGRVGNGVGMSWEIEDFLSADTADVLPADTTDVSSAGAAENLSGDTAGLCVQATAEENDKPTFDYPEFLYWTAPRLTEELAAHGREDACSPQRASLFATGSISALHKEHLWCSQKTLCSVNHPQCVVKILNRSCKTCSSRNSPFTQENRKMAPSLQSRAPLCIQRCVWKLRVPR